MFSALGHRLTAFSYSAAASEKRSSEKEEIAEFQVGVVPVGIEPYGSLIGFYSIFGVIERQVGIGHVMGGIDGIRGLGGQPDGALKFFDRRL